MSSVRKMSIDECVDLFVSDGGVEGESKADQPDSHASNKKHQAALENAKRGWPVLPIHTVDKGSCSCGNSDCTSPGKHPCTSKGVKDATTETVIIDYWWACWPD